MMMGSEFAKECLEAHNEYRAKHNVPPLKLNSELTAFAQEWADDVAGRSVMQHRSNNKYGENIFYFYSSDPDHKVHGKDAVDAWYDEIKQHTFGVEPKTTGTGHFTQVVWMDSQKLGVGVTKNSKGQVFVVCNYDPPGNFVGKFSTNVPPVGGF